MHFSNNAILLLVAGVPLLVSSWTLTAWTSHDCSGDPAYTNSGDDYANGENSGCIAFGADIGSFYWTDTLNLIAVYDIALNGENCFNNSVAGCDGSINGGDPANYCEDVENVGYDGLEQVGSYIVADDHSSCQFRGE